MLGDPHPRSAHRASPAGGLPDGRAGGLASGLASLNPQALVRQAQAGQARARQAILRQAMARQARAHQAPKQRPSDRTNPAPLQRPPGSSALTQQPADSSALDQQPPPRSALDQPPTGFSALDQHPTVPPEPNPQPTGLSPLDQHPTVPPELNPQPTGFSPLDQHPTVPPEPDPQPTGFSPLGQEAELPALGLQAVVLLAAEFQAAEQLRLSRLGPDRTPSAQHRQPRGGRRNAVTVRQRRARREPHQTLQSLMRGLAAVIIMAVVGLSAFFIIVEMLRTPERESAPPSSAEPGIASREVDAEPLTQGEVFPEPTVQLAAGAASYQVTMTHSDSECGTATTGELSTLLRDHGCDQVVRARLTAPYGGYQVTTGLFNLADENGAAQVSDLAGTLVEGGRGTFTTLGGAVDDPLAEPLAQVAWHSRGHYLLYTVVARPDGRLVTDDDPYAARITAELVGQYLGERIIGKR
jgi:hypothetical protein